LTDHHAGARARFARFTSPTLLLSFTDDDFAPLPSVQALVRALASAPLEHVRTSPVEAGAPVGHFGFFRQRFEPTLWARASDFLHAAIAGRARVQRRDPYWHIEMADVIADLEYPNVA
jgi:predicted alpha/beta hydrolase